MNDLPDNLAWKERLAMAQSEVQATLAALPEELRAPAQELPVTYEPLPNAALIADGIEAETLGLFVGVPFAESESDPSPVPAQIILFLDNLWECADGEEAIFKEEIRITLLHELGHYLGLDEDDLTDRGLD